MDGRDGLCGQGAPKRRQCLHSELGYKAVEEGLILPLKDILARAEAAYPGRLIETELEDEDGIMVYEIKMLTKDGRLMKLHYDARSGALLTAKGRGVKP